MTAGRWMRAVAGCGLLLLGPAAWAQDAGEVSFAIAFAGGQTTFRVGERIPIELSFSSSIPNAFVANTQQMDNSGRVTLDQFAVTPGGRDPLAVRNQFGSIGGGISGMAELTSTPKVFTEDLNEWVVLDKPGQYTVSATSERVTAEQGNPGQPLKLRSNALQFEVVAADPSWQSQTAYTASAALDNPAASAPERAAALRTLRFLDTPASIQSLIEELGRAGSCWDCAAGLWGAREQKLLVAAMQAQMAAPEYAITPEFLDTLAGLQSELAEKPMEPYPAGDDARQAWSLEIQARGQRETEAQEALYVRAARLVGVKRGRARAQTMRTLLEAPFAQEAFNGRSLLGGSEIAQGFLALAEDDQETVLQLFWPRLKVPEMAGPLEQVAEKHEIANGELRDVALRRLYQLDPDAGAALLRAEIEHPRVDQGRITVKGDTLGLLPEKTLPQYDALLAGRLEQPASPTFDLDAALLGRYATKPILARMKAVYAGAAAHSSCVATDGFLLYFLRVDADFGVQKMKAAPSFCLQRSLPALLEMKRWDEVEPAVIAEMNDPDLNRAGQAAETLGVYGGPKAEAALWRRLKSYHDQWANREQVFNPFHRPAPGKPVEDMGFEHALVHAMASAQGWLLDDAGRRKLEALSLKSEQQSFQTLDWKEPLPVTVYAFAEEGVSIQINQVYNPRTVEAMRAKLAQFPAGTAFSVETDGDADRIQPVVEAIREEAAARGLRVEVP